MRLFVLFVLVKFCRTEKKKKSKITLNNLIHYTTDIYRKYVWVVHLKNKKDTTITDAFQNILDESSRKPNELWVYKTR